MPLPGARRNVAVGCEVKGHRISGGGAGLIEVCRKATPISIDPQRPMGRYWTAHTVAELEQCLENIVSIIVAHFGPTLKG